MAVFVTGFLFGFLGSIPVAGPAAILIFTLSLQGKTRNARAVGLGAAVGESIFAFAAFWGIGHLLERFPTVTSIANGVAAVLLIALGAWFVRPAQAAEVANPSTPTPGKTWASFLLGASITGLNPALLGTWTAATATLASTGVVEPSPSMALPYAASAAVGIFAWFWLLVFLVARFKERFEPAFLGRVVQGMGVFLLVVGAWFAWQLFAGL